MRTALSLEDLWESPAAAPPLRTAADDRVLPPAARRYVQHAIDPAAPAALAARVRMHGQLKLRHWFPFEAQEVIHRERGMIWSATVHVNGVGVRGSDRIVDGEGAMKWKALGIVPVMNADGRNIAWSAIGRLVAELVWVPSELAGRHVTWTSSSPTQASATLTLFGVTSTLHLTLRDDGGVRSFVLDRWGNPTNTTFRWIPFGGIVEEERTCGPYTIPSQVRVGWYFGTERFEPDGEYCRVALDSVMYRVDPSRVPCVPRDTADENALVP